MGVPLEPIDARERILRKLRAYFARDRMPRLVMLLVLILTMAAGFYCSRALTSLGFTNMGGRYCCSTLAAWAVFLVLVRIWVTIERLSLGSPEDLKKLNASDGNEHDHRPWEDAGSASVRVLEHVPGDADGCFILAIAAVVLFAVIGVLLSMLGLIFGAPALLAEVFLDAVVGGLLARQLPAHDAQWWAAGVIRRTWKLVLSMAVLVTVIGAALQASNPGITTLGDLFRR